MRKGGCESAILLQARGPNQRTRLTNTATNLGAEDHLRIGTRGNVKSYAPLHGKWRVAVLAPDIRDVLSDAQASFQLEMEDDAEHVLWDHNAWTSTAERDNDSRVQNL